MTTQERPDWPARVLAVLVVLAVLWIAVSVVAGFVENPHGAWQAIDNWLT